MNGLDPRISYETIGDHQYTFYVSPYNLLGKGSNSSVSIAFDVPNSNYI
jgi:hypothetical protein